MEHFSEIYGNAYRAVAAVLRAASEAELSRQDMTRIAAGCTSDEEALYIVERLVSGQWPLLRREASGLYRAVSSHTPALPLTALQQSWLAAILADRRCAAFLDEQQRGDILAALEQPALYDCRHVEPVGMCADGDAYDRPDYAERLGIILDAIARRRVICISYTGGKGVSVKGDFLPCRLEYSSKDEKLRLYALRIRYGKAIFLATINLGRIDGIAPSREQYDGQPDVDALRRASRVSQPAVVEITDLRNALERFMVQFASYEKRTRYDDERDKYICSIYYDCGDETELLIRLLSFGPVVRLLSPDGLVEQLRQRIEKQRELMA